LHLDLQEFVAPFEAKSTNILYKYNVNRCAQGIEVDFGNSGIHGIASQLIGSVHTSHQDYHPPNKLKVWLG